MIEKESNMRWRIKNIISYLPFVYYYLGPAAFITYLLAGRSLVGRFSFLGIVFGISFSSYIILKLGQIGFYDGLYFIRLYWGFILFYLLFKSGIKINADKLLIILSLLTIAEAVLINTIISAQYLPNFPPAEAASHFVSEGYQRPYSFGGNASVTSVILMAFLAVSSLGWRGKTVVISAVSVCMSGSGFIAAIIYFLARSSRILYLFIIPIIILVIYFGDIYKISLGYISYLFDFKIEQIRNEISPDFLLFGDALQAADGGAGGDFAALIFLKYNGLAGLFLFFIFLALNINKLNWLPLLILIVGTFHYGVVFYYPGQLALGYFLNLKPDSIDGVKYF